MGTGTTMLVRTNSIDWPVAGLPIAAVCQAVTSSLLNTQLILCHSLNFDLPLKMVRKSHNRLSAGYFLRYPCVIPGLGGIMPE
jgi:hypothetical protein